MKLKLLIGFAIILLVLFAIPIKERCGGRGSCASAPDSTGVVSYRYEAKPFVFVVVDMLFGTSIPFYYYSGYEESGFSVTPKNTDTPEAVLPTGTPNASAKQSSMQFRDPGGVVRASFSSEYTAVEDIAGKRYRLLPDSVAEYSITYYPAAEVAGFTEMVNFSEDSDGENSGQGCILSTDEAKINGITFKKVYCYYNPLNRTSTGEYKKDISDIIKTECVTYVSLQSGMGVLHFSSVSTQGDDVCAFVARNLFDLKISVGK